MRKDLGGGTVAVYSGLHSDAVAEFRTQSGDLELHSRHSLSREQRNRC